MDLLKKAGKPEIEPGDEENKMEKAAEEEMEEKDNAETHNNADVGAGKRSEMDIAESVELFGKKFFQEFQPHLHTALQTRSPTVLTSGTNTSSPPAQLTIFYSGTVSIFDAVTPEKAQQIMLIAAAASTTAIAIASNDSNIKDGGVPCPVASPILRRSPSLQSTAAAVVCPQPQPRPMETDPLCKLQAELPIARRHSLQRFLEKRRDRLVSRDPYPQVTPMKLTDKPEPSSLSAEASPQLRFCSEPPKVPDEFQPTVAVHLA